MHVVCRTLLIFVIIYMVQIVRSAEWKRHRTHDEMYSNTNDTTQQQQHRYRNTHNVGNFFNLYDMIECGTRCDPWALNNYGNFCGLGGSGVPIDDIDSCCEQHDICYDDNVKLYRCTSGDVYAWAYTWSCNHGYPSCHGGEKCGFWTCVCDKAFVECVSDAGCPRR